ncbi:MAG: THUMP domain-containing protein [Pseudomonadota bacterium]
MDIRLQEYTQSYFASCAVGLEELLSKEFQSLGAKKVTLNRGGVDFKGTDETAVRGVLYSRTASRVYKRMFSFPVTTEKDIYAGGIQIPWYKFLAVDKTFKIKTILGYGLRYATYGSTTASNTTEGSFRNSLYVSQLLKDSIVDYFRKKSGKRPSVDLEKADVKILLRIVPAEKTGAPSTATIFLDVSGQPLHQRGYRSEGGKAPIKENAAAGVILMTGWDPNGQFFMDTMCGSGTFLIEAALIKGDIPPSYLKIADLRNNIHGDLKKAFENEFDAYKQKISDGLKTLREQSETNGITIFGSDSDANSLTICAKNIAAAGLQDVIKLKKIDATNAIPPAGKNGTMLNGIVFCNAPYGERLGDVESLGELYYEYGENLKNNFKGNTAFILTGNPDLQKRISLKPERKIPVYNGRIDCRLLKYSLY